MTTTAILTEKEIKNRLAKLGFAYNPNYKPKTKYKRRDPFLSEQTKLKRQAKIIFSENLMEILNKNGLVQESDKRLTTATRAARFLKFFKCFENVSLKLLSTQIDNYLAERNLPTVMNLMNIAYAFNVKEEELLPAMYYDLLIDK